jgi:hypothetical protein
MGWQVFIFPAILHHLLISDLLMMTTKDSDECATESWSWWTWDRRHQHASHSLILIFSSFQDLSWNSVYRDQLGPALKLFFNNCRVHDQRTSGSLKLSKQSKDSWVGWRNQPQKKNTRRFLGGYLAFSKTNILTTESKNRRFWVFEKHPTTAGLDERNRQRPSSFFCGRLPIWVL